MKNEKEILENLMIKYGITDISYLKQRKILSDIKFKKELDLERLEDSFVADNDFNEFIETENRINLEIHNIRVLMKYIKFDRNRKIKEKVKSLIRIK